MAPRKRKAEAASPTESLDESHHKRARSENAADTAIQQNGNAYSNDETVDDSAENTMPVNGPSYTEAAHGQETETASPVDLPRTWDEAGDADKMLVAMKDNTRYSWAWIGHCWEKKTGEKPAKGILKDRLQHLKGIMAQAQSATREQLETQIVDEPLKAPNSISSTPASKVRSPSPVISEPLEQPSHPASKLSVTPAKPSEFTSAAPGSEIGPDQDLPQSWEQANAADRLIVRMKTSCKAWAKIEEAWQKLTGEKPAENAVQDRFKRLKEFVVPPPTNRAKKNAHPVKVSDQAISRRSKSTPKAPRRRKPEAESSEESSEETSDNSSEQSSNTSSKHTITMARRKPRSAVKEHVDTSLANGPSDGPLAKRTKLTAEEPGDERVRGESSDDPDKISKASPRMAKSAKRSPVKSAVSKDPKAQNTAETADEMLVEMKESGSSWEEISEAWEERTGETRAPSTMRRRYPFIKKGLASKLLPTTQAPSKRKANAASPDKDSYESSTKRRKSTIETPSITETPNKRNMDRGKRKSAVKYTESTTDEDELYAAPVEPAATTSMPVKSRAGRAAKVDRSNPDWLVTNENSPLAYEDLQAEFSNPKTYENFTKSDWDDLRETLPPNIPVNPDGYSIPMTFFKYDRDFRRGIREFQEDLASGRLDPKWQADAAQAMEERARGDFDAYKENQFEAFWGQKQKLDHRVLAGDSTKIKLDLLIQNGIFKVGDYLSYSRVTGRVKHGVGVLVEKDCKIVGLDENNLTLAIPPGQRKYSRHMFGSATSRDADAEAKATVADGGEQTANGGCIKSRTTQVVNDTENNGYEASSASVERDEALPIEETAGNGGLPGGSKAQDADFTSHNKTEEINAGDPGEIDVEAHKKLSCIETHNLTASEELKTNGASAQTNGDQSSTPAPQAEEDIVHSISSLTQLEHRIIDIDGRLSSKTLPIQNTWKNFRGIRNNQDLGSLFEIREEFYVYKNPQIVKEPKQKR